MLRKLRRFSEAFATCGKSLIKTDGANTNVVTIGQMRTAFCGFHNDMLCSLVVATDTDDFNKSIAEEQVAMSVEAAELNRAENLFKECAKKLLMLATPETACRLMISDKGVHQHDIIREFGINCALEYFKNQRHSSVPSFAENMLDKWSDSLGSQTVLATYSPLSVHNAKSAFAQIGYKVTHIVLHELDEESQLNKLVEDFFNAKVQGSTLLVIPHIIIRSYLLFFCLHLFKYFTILGAM